ncbi:protein kinase [Streptomyces sp. NPDC057509]|uniref:protein kinase domain-containing protein n=1 Tax=Streptomyces sp. NPDC057509 TaxID=3346152 RepID=UPI00368EE922
MIVGTLGFMAPEQLVGKPVTPASDVFALGAVLTYAATGTSPFGTGSAQALNFRIAYEEPDLSRRAGPGRACKVIERCLAKDPGQRSSVTALIGELALARSESRPAAQPSRPRPGPPRVGPGAGQLSPRTALRPDSGRARAPTPARAPAPPPHAPQPRAHRPRPDAGGRRGIRRRRPRARPRPKR